MVRRLEREIDKQEERIRGLEADIAAASADYQELTRLLKQKEREDEILLELMAQWEEAAGGLA